MLTKTYVNSSGFKRKLFKFVLFHHMLKISNGLERKPAYLLPLAAVFQDTGGVIDGPVVFADRQVGALVLVHLDH